MTFAPRVPAMVNTVATCVTATQSHALLRGGFIGTGVLGANVLTQFFDGRFKAFAGGPFQLADHARGDGEPEQVGGQRLDRPFAESIRSGQQAQHGLQTWSERATRHTDGKLAARLFTTLLAHQPMQAIFGNDRLDGRQLGHLMSQWLRIFTGQRGTTAAARFRLDVERRADLFRWHQVPPVWLVPPLPAAFLSGRTFWRGTFDRWRIGRGRLGGVRGILVQPGFEFSDFALEVADDLMAEGNVVGKWGDLVTHAARSSENRRSGQEQLGVAKGRRLRKSGVWGVCEFLLTWGVNGYIS